MIRTLPKRIACFCASVLLGVCAGSTVVADDAAGLDHFERAVRPLLIKHCYECHAGEEGKRRPPAGFERRPPQRRRYGAGDRSGKAGQEFVDRSGSLLRIATCKCRRTIVSRPPKSPPWKSGSSWGLPTLARWLRFVVAARKGCPSKTDAGSGRFVRSRIPRCRRSRTMRDGVRTPIDAFVLGVLAKKGPAPGSTRLASRLDPSSHV